MQSDDNKRAIMAVVLSGLILFGWNFLFPSQLYNVENNETQAVADNANAIDTNQAANINAGNEIKNNIATQNENKVEESTIVLLNGNFTAEITSALSIASYKSINTDFNLKDIFEVYNNSVSIIRDSNKQKLAVSFTKVSDDKYSFTDNNLQISGFVFLDSKGLINFNLTSSSQFIPSFDMKAKELEMNDGQNFNQFAVQGEDLDLIMVGDEDSELVESKLSWFGLDFNYHLFAIVIDGSDLSKLETKGNKLRSRLIKPVSNFNFKSVFMRKNYDDLKELGHNLQSAVDFGIWAVIAVPILRGLQYFYTLLNNYGLAIIVLTILIRFLTFPLQYKSFVSMKKMQVVQPEMKAIREKYKDDPQRLQKETMALFKRTGANPMGGCLPMLLQMPIFFAFYKVLFTSVELVDAPFYFWISDLSEKDPFYILPVLMGIAMFLNMKLTPQTTMDPAQQKVMMLMPVMFSIFMLNLPSGLTLYILVSTIVGMLQQLFVYKKAA